MAAVFELRAGLDSDVIESTDALLLEKQDPRWSVFEDVLAGKGWIVGLFASEEEARAAWTDLRPQLTGVGEANVTALADTDWRESYKAHFKPWSIQHLHWVPIWERGTYVVPDGDVVVWLDPGMAFGTGNHETTRLCVERMIEFGPGRRSRSTLIDAGCGSGILAISAAHMGFRDVFAFDNDPDAVRIAIENARENGLEGRVDFQVRDLESGLRDRRADLIVANIQADVLVRSARRLTSAVAPGGALVMSGILAAEIDAVRGHFAREAAAAVIDSRTMGEWSDLVLRFP